MSMARAENVHRCVNALILGKVDLHVLATFDGLEVHVHVYIYNVLPVSPLRCKYGLSNTCIYTYSN